MGSVHKLYWAFDRATGKKSGYPLMLAAEKWAARHPDRIMLASVDDDHHMGSMLVCITHEGIEQRAPGKPFTPDWMGVSVIYVPQNTGEPVTFFLYPCDLDGLIDVLRALKKRMRKVQRGKVCGGRIVTRQS